MSADQEMDQLRTSAHSVSSSGEHVGFSRPEDEISKDLQIKILQDKLDFTQKQLQEKDEQLEHYKQLVKTLNDLLAEVSGRGRFPAKGILIRPNLRYFLFRKAYKYHEYYFF